MSAKGGTKVTGRGSAGLPPRLLDCIRRFGDEGWRERKQAVEEVLMVLATEQPDGPTFAALIDTLIDGVIDPLDSAIYEGRENETKVVAGGGVSARAACQDVLIQLGRASLPKVLQRLDPEDTRSSGTRLMVDMIGQIGGESEISILTGFLRDAEADENLRASAAAALGEIGGPRAIDALEQLLADDSEMLQLYALDALRAASAAVPVERLAPLLSHAVTRKGAAALLGVTSSPDAVPLLIPLLGDDMRGVRAAAIEGIARLRVALADHDLSDIVDDAVANIDDETKAKVRELIGHRERDVSIAAIALAGLAKDAGAVAAVLPRMEDPMVYERALALVERLGTAANDALVEVLDSLEVASREALYRLIGALPGEVDQRLINLLLEGLEDPLETVAAAACDALRRVGGRSAMAPLYRGCGRQGPVGEHAAEALAEVAERMSRARPGGGHDELLLLIGGSWPHAGSLARNLCRVVGRLGLLEFVPPLVSMLGSSDLGVRVAAALALGNVAGEHEGVGALCFSLADEDPQVRAAACRSLGQLADTQSVHPLLAATSDPIALVRAAAVQALVAIGNPITLARMREIILDDSSTNVVVHAIAGLGRSTQNQDLTLLMSLCASQDHEVVKAAARALKHYPAHRATAALLGLLSHERWDVRWAAAEVLSERGDVTALGPLERARKLEQDALVRQILGQAIDRLRVLSDPSSAAAGASEKREDFKRA
ncbi:HEAT repeat domain-containing protein [Enhygromyxa salina]|uniref:Putative lyase n=1 Tax=Enhygromyxa salina TaxID=215803 RepID=A0A2S9Y3I7_9BACT|nr:HEAT repeat domain-containing protein [Enhygromyxa salina]PRP99560.1 putative lyase [Enhygromyxa salina]